MKLYLQLTVMKREANCFVNKKILVYCYRKEFTSELFLFNKNSRPTCTTNGRAKMEQQRSTVMKLVQLLIQVWPPHSGAAGQGLIEH